MNAGHHQVPCYQTPGSVQQQQQQQQCHPSNPDEPGRPEQSMAADQTSNHTSHLLMFSLLMLS
jgi:hypothetical protein